MAKTNRKGRAATVRFIKLHRGVTSSQAWKSLSCEAKCLVLQIWERHNGNNNGQIPYSVREAREDLGIGSTRLTTAFKDAQDRGFIVAHHKGSFTHKTAAGKGRASEWEITAERCNGKPAKNTFRKWPPNLKTPTASVTTGNRTGSRQPPNIIRNTPGGNQPGTRSGSKTP